MTAPSTTGAPCFGVRYAPGVYGGSGGSVDCAGRPAARQMQMGADVERGGTAISGRTGSTIASLVVTMQDGTHVVIAPVHGYVLALVHRAIRDIVRITGVDGRGRAVTTQRWRD
jgi:hypothetical protein